MERQLNSSQSLSESLSLSVTKLESELTAIKHDQEEFPLSDMDLLHRHQIQVGIFDNLYEALTCPICYEFFGRDAAVSLMCGHTLVLLFYQLFILSSVLYNTNLCYVFSFCSPCFKTWEEKALEKFKNSNIQGRYEGAECAECRNQDVRRGRVRIWGEFLVFSSRLVFFFFLFGARTTNFLFFFFSFRRSS